MKLAAKLILIFLCGVLAVVALFTWQTVTRERAWDEQRRASHASDLVEALTPALEKAYRDGGLIQIEQAFEISSRDQRGAKLRWVDEPRLRDRQPSAAVSRQMASVTVTNADGTRMAYRYFPMQLDEDHQGAVEVALPLGASEEFFRGSLLASLVSLLGVAALSGLVIYFGGVQLVGKPLETLIEQVNSIGDGNLDQQVAVRSNDEFGRLAAAISQMSHRLSQQRAAIRRTDRLGTVGTLAAGLAHEMGTPLNVVSGRAGLIASGKLSADEVRDSAQTIKQQADRMTTIIRQLLDFARQTPAADTEVELREVINATCDLMQPLAHRRGIELQCDAEKFPLIVRGDAGQIQQVLTNLLSNAFDASTDQSTVRVQLRSDQGQARIDVIDTGAGLTEEKMEHIFEPFFTTKDVGQGTGLGLSIAYGIVQEHGGNIHVESEPNRQTTFTVTLPLIAAVTSTAAKQ